VGVATIYEVDERAFYRFLTEDLMQEEIDDFRIKGMMHNFIYEDFYPNDEGDLRKYSEEFIAGLQAEKDERSFDFMFLMNEITLKQQVYKKNEAVNYFNLFRDAYEEICLKYFEITSIEIQGEIGNVNFDINYEVKKRARNN